MRDFGAKVRRWTDCIKQATWPHPSDSWLALSLWGTCVSFYFRAAPGLLSSSPGCTWAVCCSTLWAGRRQHGTALCVPCLWDQRTDSSRGCRYLNSRLWSSQVFLAYWVSWRTLQLGVSLKWALESIRNSCCCKSSFPNLVLWFLK